MTLELVMLGAVFLVTAIAIALWQRRAARCAKHRRGVGIVAWLLAATAALAGVFLLAQGIGA